MPDGTIKTETIDQQILGTLAANPNSQLVMAIDTTPPQWWLDAHPEECVKLNDGTVSKNYSDTALVWNSTLKQYSTHLALDFTSEDKNVFASCDGTVKETGYNALDGYYVILTHKDGYETRYLSLEAESTLKKGATVKQGQLLGKASATQGSESLDGDHVHFEVLKDGVNVNPLEIMVSSEK